MESEEYSVRFKELEAAAREFPALPGVYLMKDVSGKIIYIGKAKSLRARVRNYFARTDERYQVEFLLQRIFAIDKIVTANEEQALVLERDLISKHKPRYNIRLKDDKSYLSIRVNIDDPWPRLDLVRKREDDGARYFGPYSFSYELRALLEIIKRVVPLRTCNNTVFFNRQRPCLEYQIKRCAGPCCLEVDRDQYRKWVKQAISILEGRTDRLIGDLNEQMERASSELRFEDAAIIRDRVELLEQFSKGASVLSSRGERRDVVGLCREERFAAVTILKINEGRIADSSHFQFNDLEIRDAELVERALEQFYEKSRDIPSEVLVPIELQEPEMLENLLSAIRGSAVKLSVPQRGIGKRLLDLAELNAREHFKATFDAETRYRDIAKRLSLMCKLSQVPRRIECVDISNFQGSDTVGAVVSFFDGEPDKSRYRRYDVVSNGAPDDFAAIQEVVGRRLERGSEEASLPDLLVIDGGKGQLNMALEAAERLGLSVDIIALAKIRVEADAMNTEIKQSSERIFLQGLDEPIELPDGDEVTRLMQRIRDEVHRFVITFHRSKRSRRVVSSLLDKVPGIGAERRKRLLKHFGSVEELMQQKVGDIATVGRMPESVALRLLEILQARGQNKE